MKRYALLAISLAVIVLLSVDVSGNGEVWSYDDESGDVQFTMGDSGNRNDIDVVSLTLDQSGDPLILTMTIVGDITGEYGTDGEDGYNSYTLGLDLDGDEDYADINVKINGMFYGEDLYVSISTPSTIEPLGEENFTISGSTFTARIDRVHMGTHPSVLDFTGSLSQTFGINMGFDYINYDFGGDDRPYDEGSSADDDDTTDDDTDDDTDNDTDDDDDEEDEDTDNGLCGSFLIITGIISMGAVVIAAMKRKDH